MENDVIEYAIYCRKSTDDEENQKTSIYQQLEKCFEFAEKNELLLQTRDENFPVDQDTVKEIEGVLKTSPQQLKEFLEKYTTHQIIIERRSAKMPFRRPLWDKLMRLADEGKIRGLVSYSPDRNARNTTEGGILINKADNGLLSLKYTNFQFENNPSGHMMLGIFFVFAEHYSKKLSEDTTRGTLSKFEEGKASGVSKVGYTTDDQDYFIPHPVHFPILQKAFQRKLHDNWSDTKIAEEMNASGWDAARPMTANSISTYGGGIWRDSFFYGVWTRDFQKLGTIQNDLRQLSGYNFKPLISEEDFFALQEKLIERNNKSIEQRQSRATQKLDTVMPLAKGIVIDAITQKPLNFTVPNPKRFLKKLEDAKAKNPNAIYGDVIKSNQITYSLPNNNVNYEEIDKLITKHLQGIKIPDLLYKAFLHKLRKEVESGYDEKMRQQKDIQKMINKNRSNQEKFMKDSNFGLDLKGDAARIYKEEEQRYADKEKSLLKSQLELSEATRNEYLEHTAFFELFTNLPKLWAKASYVQKRKISEI